MTAEDAIDVMNTVLLNAWVAFGLDAADIRWTDVTGGVPAEEVVWARAVTKHATGGLSTFGDNQSSARTHENTGTYWVQCFAPIGAGQVTALQTAQAVVTALRNSQNAALWFRNVRLKEVGTSGAFEQINVLADFTYDN